MQTLFWGNSSKISDDKCIRPCAPGAGVAVECYAQRNNVHFALGNREILRHETRIILAHRQEGVDELDIRPDQVSRQVAVPVLESLDKQVLTLERAKHRPVQRLLDWPCQSDQQRVGQDDYIRLGLGLHPVNQLLKLFSLQAVLAFEHRDG